jgi:hypothetical protein
MVNLVINGYPITDGRHTHGVRFHSGGAAVVDEHLGSHQPGYHISLVGYLHSFTLAGNLMINFLILCRMRPHDDIKIWKLLVERWNEFLKVIKDRLLVVPEGLGELAGHAFGGFAELRFFSRSFQRLEQVLARVKRIYVVKIGVNQDEITISPSKSFGVIFIERQHIRPQQIPPWVSGDMDWYILPHLRILTPQFSVVFAPCEEVGDILKRQG